MFSRIHFSVHCIGFEKINRCKIFLMLILEQFLFTGQCSINEQKIKAVMQNIFFTVLFVFSGRFYPIPNYRRVVTYGWTEEHSTFYYIDYRAVAKRRGQDYRVYWKHWEFQNLCPFTWHHSVTSSSPFSQFSIPLHRSVSLIQRPDSEHWTQSVQQFPAPGD